MIDLFLSNNRIAVFLEQKKKSHHSKHMKGFSIIRGSNIFRRRSDRYILAKRFCQHQIENYKLEDNF